MENISLNNKTILITGAAGFIGSALTIKLLELCKDCRIIGIDNLNDYYDPELKRYRLRKISKAVDQSSSLWEFHELDIADTASLTAIFQTHKPSVVINLAAQAGVRYSITNPSAYIRSNVDGFFNVLECCRTDSMLEHLVYASSSSVYGGRV